MWAIVGQIIFGTAIIFFGYKINSNDNSKMSKGMIVRMGSAFGLMLIVMACLGYTPLNITPKASPEQEYMDQSGVSLSLHKVHGSDSLKKTQLIITNCSSNAINGTLTVVFNNQDKSKVLNDYVPVKKLAPKTSTTKDYYYFDYQIKSWYLMPDQ